MGFHQAPKPAAHALFLIIAAVSCSCSASAGMVLKADRSLSVSMALSLPQPVDAWARGMTGAGDKAPLFDPAAVAAGARTRGFTVLESSSPTAGSYRGSFSVPDLDAFVSAPRPAVPADDTGRRPSPAGSLSSLGILRVERGPGWASLRMRMDRQNASAILDLFPGVDRQLLESLMPPAAWDNPVTKAQYRSMLGSLMGKAAGNAVDAAVFTLSLTLPGPIIESKGGSAGPGTAGRTVSFSMPALDAMTLETPAEFYVKWSE